MNIIRTTALELQTIPAIAYKQKLASGGSGIKIFRIDQEAVAVISIDRRTGEGQPYGAMDAKLFPEEAINEAIELTLGLPYSARGKLTLSAFMKADASSIEDVNETETAKIDMVGSDEYQAIVARYQNEKGKLNYTLMNKDFIQYTAKSAAVEKMLAEEASADDILRFVVKNRAAFIANKKEHISDQEADGLIETLDEINPRSAFKELVTYIRRLCAKK